MLTHSGVHMMPDEDAAPSPEDLAVQMGRLCQYGGAIWHTLLAHSVFVGELAWRAFAEAPRPARLANWAWGILHDAHEVVTGDVPRGWKTDDMRARQRDLDRRIMRRYVANESLLDLDAIKRLDEQATRIQCVGLGLRGYRELKMEQDGRDPNEDIPTEDWLLLSVVLAGGFSDPGACVRPESEVIRLMVRVFEHVQEGNLPVARAGLEGWLASRTAGSPLAGEEAKCR